MLPQSDVDQLTKAWRALEGGSTKQGWRSILVEQGKCYALRAGRWFPENLEAILIGLDGTTLPTNSQLPKGGGFTVIRTEVSGEHGQTWLALCRETGADKAFFEMMTADVVQILRTKDVAGSHVLAAAVLARIVAWQEFMRKTNEGVLSSDEELGLLGELSVLRELQRYLPLEAAVGAWVGPLDGLQDFAFPPGAIEVKTTAAGGAFVAKISCLEQLDTAVTRPIFIAAVRLLQTSSGMTLSECIDDLRRDLSPKANAAAVFEHRLAKAGYRDESRERYSRRFSVVDIGYLSIEQGTPRLVPGSVPLEVRSARYELDLSAMPNRVEDLAVALKALGVC